MNCQTAVIVCMILQIFWWIVHFSTANDDGVLYGITNKSLTWTRACASSRNNVALTKNHSTPTLIGCLNRRITSNNYCWQTNPLCDIATIYITTVMASCKYHSYYLYTYLLNLITNNVNENCPIRSRTPIRINS